jgi:integrase
MNHPDAAAALAGLSGAQASPFAALDVCAEAGLSLRPAGRMVLFAEDVWHFADLEGLPVQMRGAVTRMDFTTISDPRWRLVAKEYLLARLAPSHPRVAVLARAYRVPLTVGSCSQRLAETARWLNWLTGQQTGSLGGVTQDHCDRYLAERRLRRSRAGAVVGNLDESVARVAAAVIIELGLYGELFTADRYPDGFLPWNGRSSSQVAGMRPPTQNKTPLVGQEILQPLLAAALYAVKTLGPHVVTVAQRVRQRRRHSAGLPETRIAYTDVELLLRQHIQTGVPLEAARDVDVRTRLVRGWDPADPLLHLSVGALAREAGVRRLRSDLVNLARPLLIDTIRRVGVQKPWARHPEAVPRADQTEAVAWTLPLDERDVRDLAGYLHTACLLVTAAVSGMRESELMELRVGCRRTSHHGNGMIRHRLASKVIKGQPLGGTDDEWVVVEEVDHAVALAEQLAGDADDGLVFGRFSFEMRYRKFRDWVNGPAGQRLGLAAIPEGVVNMRMLRRTLSHELAYRPGGLLATKIALKHVSVVTTEGYTARPGGSQAKLLAEISEHETERNLQLVLAEFRNYQDGVMPTGPGARELTEFFDHVDGDLAANAAAAPNVVASDQHILNLLSRRAHVLHLGAANYCWFTDPSRALCLRLAGTPTADKPLAGMCDSARCPQATHHPCHRPVWADTVDNTTAFLGSLGRTRKTERARLQAELDRAQRILTAIDTTTTGRSSKENPQPCASPTNSAAAPNSRSAPPPAHSCAANSHPTANATSPPSPAEPESPVPRSTAATPT